MVRAVHAFDSFKRKPEEFKYQSFFGLYDIWHYIPIFDVKLCDRCMRHAESTYFSGLHLRGLFPYLKIRSRNIIEPWVHPNCRCILRRITDPTEYLMVTAELAERGIML